jgi:hypothetical protein
MPDQETWRFINTFAGWLSATGTLVAVITSLYLARRSDRIRLKVTVGMRQLGLPEGHPDQGAEVMLVGVTNLGRRGATITLLFWRPVPWRRKEGFVGFAPVNPYSLPFPTTLTDGQVASYAFPSVEFQRNFGDYSRNTFGGTVGWIRLRLLRFEVQTSTGNRFAAAPERPVKSALRRLAQERRPRDDPLPTCPRRP